MQLKTLVGGAEGFDAQQAMVTPVQRHGSARDTDGVHQAAAQGIAGGGGAVPHLAAIQQSFGGVDVSGVKAHTDGKAGEASRAMGASAYATGNDVAFDGAPDLHTAAHEVAHVVQQRAGVQLSGGVGQSGDAYEKHADQVADAVVAGKSAEPLLTGGSGAGGGVQRRAIQRQTRNVQMEGDGPQTTTTPSTTTTTTTTTDTTPTPTVETPTPLTQAECLGHAREIEVKFGAEAATSGDSLAGAQALLAGCADVIAAYVPLYNEKMRQGTGSQEEILASLTTVDSYMASKMGTPVPSVEKPGTAGIAGGVGPAKVLDHVKTLEGGNLRTKMTAVFNFMSTLSTIAIEQEKAKNETFFAGLGEKGALLKQAAIDAKANLEKAVAEHEEKKKNGELGPKTIGAVDSQLGVEGLGATTETTVSPSPHGPRESILGPAPSVASEQGDARFNRPRGLETGGGAYEKRKADDASLGEGLHPDEIEFMSLEKSKLDQQYLTWSEGLSLYVMDSENEWVKKQMELGLPVGAGPASGTTDRFMQIGQMLKCTPLGTRAASLGYLLSINAHTLVEIMTSAAPYGFSEPLDGYSMYRSIAPFGSLEKHANARFWGEKVNPTTTTTTPPTTTGGTGG